MVDYIDGHREEFGVEPICTVLQFAPSTYYAVKTRPPSVRQIEDEENTAFSHLEDAAPAVELANALARRFPEGRRLEFIHMPFAHGSQPPRRRSLLLHPAWSASSSRRCAVRGRLRP